MPGEAISYSDRYFTPKALTRKQAHSERIAVSNKLDYKGFAARGIRALAKQLHSRALELRQPIQKDVITKSGEVVTITVRDDKALAEVSRAYLAALEMERVVLRIPGPGRDSAAEQRTINVPSAPTLDVEGIMREAAGAMEAMPDAATAPTSDPASASSHSTP